MTEETILVLVKPISGGYTRRSLEIEGDIVVKREAKVANPFEIPKPAKIKTQRFPPKVMDLMSPEQYLNQLTERYMADGFEIQAETTGGVRDQVWFATPDVPLERVNEVARKFQLAPIDAEQKEPLTWTLGRLSATAKRTNKTVRITAVGKLSDAAVLSAFIACLVANANTAVVDGESVTAKSLVFKHLKTNSFPEEITQAIQEAGVLGPQIKVEQFTRSGIKPASPLSIGL